MCSYCDRNRKYAHCYFLTVLKFKKWKTSWLFICTTWIKKRAVDSKKPFKYENTIVG